MTLFLFWSYSGFWGWGYTRLPLYQKNWYTTKLDGSMTTSDGTVRTKSLINVIIRLIISHIAPTDQISVYGGQTLRKMGQTLRKISVFDEKLTPKMTKNAQKLLSFRYGYAFENV